MDSAVRFINIVASPHAKGSHIGMPMKEGFELCQTPSFMHLISANVPITAPTRKKIKSL